MRDLLQKDTRDWVRKLKAQTISNQFLMRGFEEQSKRLYCDIYLLTSEMDRIVFTNLIVLVVGRFDLVVVHSVCMLFNAIHVESVSTSAVHESGILGTASTTLIII